MRHFILFVLFLLIASVSYAQEKDPKVRRQIKQTITQGCMEGCAPDADKETYGAWRAYCDCVAEKVLTKWNKRQMDRYERMKDKEKSDKIFNTVTQACLEQFTCDLQCIEQKKRDAATKQE